MSTAHRPTWNPSRGGGGLRDGSTAPPTLQHSSKDQTAHTRLKYLEDLSPRDSADEEAFFRDESPDALLKEDDGVDGADSDALGASEESAGAQGALLQAGSDSGEASEADESEDEELLYKELQKIKAERAQKALAGPLATAPLVVKRRWEEEGVVFRKQAVKRAGEKRFINDTTRSDYHRQFIDRYIK